MASLTQAVLPQKKSVTMGPLSLRYGAYGPNGAVQKSPTPYPIFNGPAAPGMPSIQRAFASGKENAGITQLLPNVTQTAGNGAPQLVTPQLSRTTIGQKGFTPGEALNLETERQNQLQAAEDQRRQSALNLVKTAYDNSIGASEGIGQQAYNRINTQTGQATAKAQSGLISRGLGNSTVTSAVNNTINQQAEDARQGVDESIAQRRIGLEQAYGGQGAQLLTGQPLQDQAGGVASNALLAKTKGNTLKSILGTVGGNLLGSISGKVGGAIGGSIAGIFG